jgi:hypothetical protein
MEPAYDYSGELGLEINVGGETERRTFPQRDQFAPELIYFSECVRSGRTPEPNGYEGLADVRIIEAAYNSAQLGRPVSLSPLRLERRPGMRQVMQRPAVEKPNELDARGPRSP